MNIDQMTIGEFKELSNLFNASNKQAKPNIFDQEIGKFVIVRTRNEGINAGTIERLDETGIVLKDCRRLWFHKPKNEAYSWYEGVSQYGMSDDSRVSCTVPYKLICEDYSITYCNNVAEKSIMEAVPNAQS